VNAEAEEQGRKGIVGTIALRLLIHLSSSLSTLLSFLISLLPILHPRLSIHLQMLLDSGLQRPLVGSYNLSNLLAVLKQQECRHSSDAKLLRYI